MTIDNSISKQEFNEMQQKLDFIIGFINNISNSGQQFINDFLNIPKSIQDSEHNQQIVTSETPVRKLYKDKTIYFKRTNLSDNSHFNISRLSSPGFNEFRNTISLKYVDPNEPNIINLYFAKDDEINHKNILEFYNKCVKENGVVIIEYMTSINNLKIHNKFQGYKYKDCASLSNLSLFNNDKIKKCLSFEIPAFNIINNNNFQFDINDARITK